MKVWLGIGCILTFFSLPDLYGQPFSFGCDLSYAHEMEDCGTVYKENDQAMDPYQVLRDHGCNLVRLRLWHTPSWYDGLNQGHRYGDFEDVRFSIQRAKDLGMKVLLDYHLSDTWADPTHQVVPVAWASVADNLPVLEDSLYQYVLNTLTTLDADGLLPEMVQIGNETNKGILLSQQVNDQGWSVDWSRNAALFNKAIEAVRAVETNTGKSIKIALHIADPSEVAWWMDQFWTHGVRDFDIFGISYYQAWHQDLIPAVGQVISNLKSTYPGKEVMILETAYPWTSAAEDNATNLLNTVYPGYPFSPASQNQWLIELTQVVIDHGGDGVVYWEPDWVSTECRTLYGKGSNWENCTFFDFDNNLIQDGGINWMDYGYDFSSGLVDPDKKAAYRLYWLGQDLFIQRRDGLSVSGNLVLSIYNIEGRLIRQVAIATSNGPDPIKIGLPEISPGLYIAEILGIHDTYSGVVMFYKG